METTDGEDSTRNSADEGMSQRLSLEQGKETKGKGIFFSIMPLQTRQIPSYLHGTRDFIKKVEGLSAPSTSQYIDQSITGLQLIAFSWSTYR